MEGNEKILKCEIKLDRIFFPKNKYEVESGEYAIFSAFVVKEIENCENLYSEWENIRIKLKGKVCRLESHTTYTVSCKLYETHELYGDTYEILFINRKIDLSNKSKQIEFLEEIINPKTVHKLFEQFDDVISLLENHDIAALTTVKGIGHATAMRIIQEYEDSKDYSYICTELNDLSLTPNLIKKLLDFYKSPETVVDIIKTNPYKLIEISGIGFKTADKIAQQIGITGNDPRRVKACIINTLIENGEIGKSYLHFGELMNIVYNQLGYIEQDIINDVAKQLVDNKEINVSNDGQYIGIKKYYDLECDIYNELMRLNNDELMRLKNAERESPFDIVDWESIVKEVESEQGYEFTNEQFIAIRESVNNNIIAITGGAGSGKTSTSNAICRIYSNYNIEACALSGKAAVRITEATGLKASTIHKLLGYQNGEFLFNRSFPLETDVIVIDEATMINGDIFLSLLQALKDGTKILMLGDYQQLTPIGNCQVFTDILNTNKIPIVKLTQLHRQAQASGIIPTSIKIANQEQIFNSSFEGNTILGELQDMELDIYKKDEVPSDRVIRHFLEQYYNTNNLMETQILSPMRTRGDLSTYNLNNKIQAIVNPVYDDDIFLEVQVNKDSLYKIKLGDKVINVKNNYNTVDTKGNVTPIFNGNMGIIKEIDYGACVVDFVGIGEVVLDRQGMKNLELGYAITIHKSQGSGFHTAIVAIESAAYVLLNAEMLYTGITRAKKHCVLVGQNYAIRTAINKREVNNKQTYLKHFLSY